MVYIKSAKEICKIQQAAELWKLVANLAESMIVVNSSGKAIADVVAAKIRENGGSCAFENYRGFPERICVSLNHVAIHGIPNLTPFKCNDKVGIDIGVNLDEAICDAGFSRLVVGSDDQEYQKLIDHTYQALWAGIRMALHGNRVGDITHAIESYVQTNCPQYAIVEDFSGHGCGNFLHEGPHVPNYGMAPGQGVRLVSGMVICIEPILTNQPNGKYQIDPTDQWSVKVKQNYKTAHFEHMILILEPHSVVLTARNQELANKIITR